jgi:putative redox protein
VISRSENEMYLTEISNGKEEIYADVAQEKGGSGNFFRPHDLLEAAYASCLNITTRMVLDSLNIPYEAVTVKVELERRDEVTIFHYDIDIAGTIDEKMKQIVLKQVTNCPVKKTLSRPLAFQPAQYG